MSHTEQKTILIVDDSPSTIDLLREILRAVYRLKVANNGEKALQLASGVMRPDLILLDVMMPDMDGYQVMERLQADERTRSIPVIFVTANSDAGDEAHGLSLGAVDYLTKPIKPAVVAARVHTHLELADARRETEILLHRTLMGSVDLLTDVLSMANPEAFNRSTLIGRNINRLLKKYVVSESWNYRLAGMLSELGQISVRHARDASDPALMGRIGADLIRKIPRLELAAEVIERQTEDLQALRQRLGDLSADPVALGILLLRAALMMLERKNELDEEICAFVEQYAPGLLTGVPEAEPTGERVIRQVGHQDLQVGMVLSDGLRARDESLLIPANTELTTTLLGFIGRLASAGKIKEPIEIGG